MAKDIKRTKQVEEMIKNANVILRVNKVTDPLNDTLFIFLINFLTEKRMYQGYNYYKEQDGRLYLAGTSDPSKFDCVQFY